MDTIKHNGKDIPIKYADVKVTIKHKETGVVYRMMRSGKASELILQRSEEMS